MYLIITQIVFVTTLSRYLDKDKRHLMHIIWLQCNFFVDLFGLNPQSQNIWKRGKKLQLKSLLFLLILGDRC